VRKGFHDRLHAALLAMAVLTLLAALPPGAGAAAASATPAAADSSRPAGAVADSSHATPPPAAGSSTAPHDAVHMHAAPAPTGGHAASGPKPKPFKVVVLKGSPRVLKVSLGVRHRVFPDFAEKSEAVMGKSFQIGDTRFSATITDFEPDFVIDLPTHSITSRSIEPKNPAFRLIVREQGVPQDTTWAFLNMPPHFARNSLLAFEILRIEFADRPPLLRDSTDLGRPKE
jgi:hypothetical protein